MLTLSMRSYCGNADLQPIAALFNACHAVDSPDYHTTVEGLRFEFNDPDYQPENGQLWELDGQIVAYAYLWRPKAIHAEPDAYLDIKVHPQQRQSGLAQEVLAWGEARLRQIVQQQNIAMHLRSSCRASQRDRIVLLEQNGFIYERCFLTMSRSLAEPIPEPQFPQGFKLIDATQESDDAKFVELYNQTFIDHWNFHPISIEQIQYWLKDPYYRPELDLVALASDGTYAGFCFCYVDPQENEKHQRKDGWINSLGTRRGFRRIGLGRALLLAGLHCLKSAGMETAKLGVDTANPNSAQTLYESVGFRKLYASLTYSKTLHP